jgi:hypothetical protein
MLVLASQIQQSVESLDAYWSAEFARRSMHYNKIHVVYYSGKTESLCGQLKTEEGPIFCSEDNSLYIDLDWFAGAIEILGPLSGEIVRFLMAHEVGHHVQILYSVVNNLWKYYERVYRDAPEQPFFPLFEMQADCLAGVFLSTQKLSVEERQQISALVHRLGDENTKANEKSYPHGRGGERLFWFKRGLQLGRLEVCETFSKPSLVKDFRR